MTVKVAVSPMSNGHCPWAFTATSLIVSTDTLLGERQIAVRVQFHRCVLHCAQLVLLGLELIFYGKCMFKIEGSKPCYKRPFLTN